MTGSFIIRGKKNYVNPPRLELGYTVLFGIDDMSVERHKNERKPRGINEEGEPVLLPQSSTGTE